MPGGRTIGEILQNLQEMLVFAHATRAGNNEKANI
jgi:hypothetical protein